MNKSKKPIIFLTGGAGFIGSHLTERLVKHGYKVKIFDNLSRNAIKYTNILKNSAVEFVQGDILDMKKLAGSMKGTDAVLHLAAIAGVSNYYKFPAKTLKTNLIGTYNVLEAMLQNKVLRIIDMSTSEIFGTDAIEASEETYFKIGPPDDKRWSYAASKIGGEQFIYRYADEFHLNATVVRPFNIYGPRQVGEGAISNFCKKILEGGKIKIEGTGASSRSWCYIDDFVDVLMLLIEKPHRGVDNFNIGNPWQIRTNYDLAQLVIRHAENFLSRKFVGKFEYVPMPFTEIKVRYPNINKIKNAYNWYPKIDLEQGVSNTFKWFVENYKEK